MRRYPLFVGYAILVFAVMIGFVRVEAIQRGLQREIHVRQESTCVAYDQLESIMERIVTETSVDPGLAAETDDPDLSALLEQQAERSAQFRQRVRQLLEEAECPVFE